MNTSELRREIAAIDPCGDDAVRALTLIADILEEIPEPSPLTWLSHPVGNTSGPLPEITVTPCPRCEANAELHRCCPEHQTEEDTHDVSVPTDDAGRVAAADTEPESINDGHDEHPPWIFCPACGHDLDTGWGCTHCQREWGDARQYANQWFSWTISQRRSSPSRTPVPSELCLSCGELTWNTRTGSCCNSVCDGNDAGHPHCSKHGEPQPCVMCRAEDAEDEVKRLRRMLYGSEERDWVAEAQDQCDAARAEGERWKKAAEEWKRAAEAANAEAAGYVGQRDAAVTRADRMREVLQRIEETAVGTPPTDCKCPACMAREGLEGESDG